MTTTLPETGPAMTDQLVDEAVALARRWDEATRGTQTRAERQSSGRLAALVSDPAGLELAVRFVDRVARPEDRKVAARELGGLLTKDASSFLGPVDRTLMTVGARVAPLVPDIAVPAARVRLRQLVGHLVGDAEGRGLTKALARTRAQGFTVNVNLLGEAVLGEAEAARRLQGIRTLIARPDVDYVSVKASAVAAQLSTWDHEGSRRRLVERLLPLLQDARAHGVFVNLDMEEYHDLDLTVAVFCELLGELPDLHAGIVLQGYLPDSGPALDTLTAFARTHPAGIKVRLVKGANLAMERVEAALHGWHQAPYGGKPEVDANYVRLLRDALTPERTEHVRIGVASHNLFDVAYAHLLSQHRGVAGALDVEMLQGMAPAQARAVKADVGRVVLYAPVVARDDFDVAVSYLVRRLEENAAPENFLHDLFADGLDGQEQAFRASVRDHTAPSKDSRRLSLPPAVGTGFENASDSDAALPATRAWAAAALTTDPGPLETPELASFEEVDATVARALAAGSSLTDPAVRARLLHAVGDRLAGMRPELVSVMAHEAGKTVAEADPEISEAIDFAHYYAFRALDVVPGAVASPVRCTLVTPPWNFPVAIALGGALAAVAAGSPALLKPPPQTPRCLEVTMRAVTGALADLELPADVVQLVRVPENEVGQHLVTHPQIDRVILTGALETAELFTSWRADLPLLAETSGKNALVVTASADLDLAVADVVKSAFGHAGQKCSAASLLILVGSVATSDRFLRQLVDAVQSLVVGPGTDLATTVGPLVEEPGDKLLRALTQLDPGESWLVQPQRLGDRTWSPGIRAGVKPGSWFHRTECFGPVLGVMVAKDLDEALTFQNATAYGLTGGLHSLHEGEIDQWLSEVEVGNAYVNRGTTGAIVRRQSFGGWKASAIGPGAKAGGPHYVAQLADWADSPDVPAADQGWLAWARADDARAWAQQFSVEHDPSALGVETNVFRYRPIEHLWVRVAADAPEREVQRVLSAASTAGVRTTVRRDDAFESEVAAGRVTGRVRVIGTVPGLRAAAAGHLGTVTVLDHPVLASGERELLTVLREQAISRTMHRYGHLPPAPASR